YAPANYHQILLSHLRDFDIHLNFEIKFTSLSGNDPARILDDKFVTVTAFPLKHRIEAYGFLFREKPGLRKIIKESIDRFEIPTAKIPSIKKGEAFITKAGTIIKNEDITLPPSDPLSYAYCSDTMYFDRLAGFIKNVSVLYHEATFDKSLDDLAKFTFHSTTSDAANTANRANAGALIIGHFSARYKDINPLLEEARAIFPNTFPAIDGATYDISELSSRKIKE
ncbi:MAG: ribonuclease Z, partial [Bacteroidales bacterium]